MSLFKNSLSPIRCGAVIDVGSGSVGIAIVVSSPTEQTFEVVWSHREYMLIKEASEGTRTLKEINTTIVNALLELGGNGLKTLSQFNRELSIKYVQIAICAPWSYTISNTIHYEDEHPFEVTKELIDQLVVSAKNKSTSNDETTTLTKDLELRLITEETASVELNGYSIKQPENHEVRTISISQINAFVQEKIITTIEDSLEKILPKAIVDYYSFMYLFYQVLKNLHPDTSEICLVDVTNEATEIGIVRDNILKQTTHAPLGLFTISREIAAACNIPNEEAYTLMKDGNGGRVGCETKLEVIFASYEDAISKLFMKTGDTLSIPKTLFLHSSQLTEKFFSTRIANAATKATHVEHSTHLVTSELLDGGKKMNDSALALSAHYFHTKGTSIRPYHRK